MLRRHLALPLLAPFAARVLAQSKQPSMLWADSSQLDRPFSKDPSVIRFRDRYLLYYSMPRPTADDPKKMFWALGVAESRDLNRWIKIGEIQPEQECEKRGIAAPFARVIGNDVHLFYQTYGFGPEDAICHAVSSDGLSFRREPTNPIFRPTGDWNAGRAIDADVIELEGRWLLYAATRDPQMKVQMVVGASAPKQAGFARGNWTLLANQPLLKPELPWEKDCIEAPSVLRRGKALFMFYAGGYNNAPQQIGCARSTDGVKWQRLSTQPLLANGAPGEWNSSESGHPGAFVDEVGRTWLFFQGNNDNGRTWLLSKVEIGWHNEVPYLR